MHTSPHQPMRGGVLTAKLLPLPAELALSDMQRGRDGGSARPPGLGGGLPVSTGAGPGGQGKPRFTINDED